MIPDWLHFISLIMLGLGIACAAGVALDEVRAPQKMWIMNVVWPLTALYSGPLGVFLYKRHGKKKMQGHMQDGGASEPFAAKVAKGACHCGSGCTLGDLVAETVAFIFPGVAVWFGWHSLFDNKIFSVWILDYILAFALGIIFQYFTIKPMRDISPGEGIVAAVKADTLSLSAWQIGMYGFMAVAHFWIFGSVLNAFLTPAMPEFWFMMQIAMLCGFVTSFPVNWWLIRKGLKEAM